MKVEAIKAFSDNYIWVIEEKDEAVVVDPGEAKGVLGYLKRKNLKLKAILLTHNHDDHTGGVFEILENYPETPVYGPEETSAFVNSIVEEGDSFELLGERFDVIFTPGHTAGHISYVMRDGLFCGDALFSGGCGRVFTGDYDAQYKSLQKFKTLDNRVLVYAGHEYTETNLRFAQTVEPNNPTIMDTLEVVKDRRSKDLSTLPSTISKEKDINLFLQAESLEQFRELRLKRDDF